MLRIVPANQAACDDLQVVFGDRGTGHVCQCQRYKLSPGESFGVVPREERMLRLWDQTDCGNPGSDRTTGLVGYLGDQPVAWCAVEPRSDYEGLLRVYSVEKLAAKLRSGAGFLILPSSVGPLKLA